MDISIRIADFKRLVSPIFYFYNTFLSQLIMVIPHKPQKYIVHLCERNSEIIQYKFEAFPETRVTFYTKIPGRFFSNSGFFFTKTSSYYLIRIMNY